MIKPFFTISAIAILLCFAGADAAFPQAANGTVAGTVIDQSRAIVVGAEVSLTSQASNHTIAKRSSDAGTFVFPELTPGYYDLKVNHTGFKTFVATDIKVDVAKTHTITATLEVGEITELVTVTAGGAELLAQSDAEVAPTVSTRQIDELPLNGRKPLELIMLNAGAATTPTYLGDIPVINGNRATFTNINMDGVNVQNNWVRAWQATLSTSLYETVDQVSEFTMVTAAQGSESGFGSNQVNMVTPSGSNNFHGGVYWAHRNDALAANSFFNNKDGIEKNQLIRNQYGISVSGPILRNKLLFFGNFEGLKSRSQESMNGTVLTPDMREGIFTYTADDDSIRKLNILDAAGVTMDSYMYRLLEKVPTDINNFRVGDSTESQLKNTAGYSYGQSRNVDKHALKFRLDYIHNDRHRFQGIYQATKATSGLGEGTFKKTNTYAFLTGGGGYKDFFSTAWDWTISPTFINEVRVGATLGPDTTRSDETFPDGFKIGFGTFTNPVNNFEPLGYENNVWTINDNANWEFGAHSLRFGFQSNIIRFREFDCANCIPQYNLGLSSVQTIGLTETDFPGGIGGAELDTANNLMATLGGILSSGNQSYTVDDPKNPAFHAVPTSYNWQYDTYALYVRDNWKISPGLTLNLGLRWEYSPNLKERNNLISQIIPEPGQSMPEALLDPNAAYDLLKGDLVKKDLNNFAPSVGFAWDMFGNSRTVMRGGYSIAYVNDEAIGSTADLMSRFGVNEDATLSNLTGTISGGLPAIPAPEFELPLSLSTIAARNATMKEAAGTDPNLVIPYVQSWQFGIQQQIGAETAIEIRYVGTKGTKMKRVLDIDQVEIFENGFLEDFLRARSNGFLAEAQGSGFDPSYNAAITGSQPLTIYPQLFGGGLLWDSGIRSVIKRGEVGTNAFIYQLYNLTGGFPFSQNPNANAAHISINQASSIYHGLQVEVRRRLRNGLSFNANYTFSKVLTDGYGATPMPNLSYYESLTDMYNPGYDRGRAPFDLTHAFRANFLYDLPVGRGRRYDLGNSIGNHILGGWTITSIFTWQSGRPFGIYSRRGTLNNSIIASGRNRANSTLDQAGIKDLFGISEDADGNIYFINPKAINPIDGRGVADDGQPSFAGQVFFHPEPGTLGGLPHLGYNGPGLFVWDFSAIKKFRITEEVDLEFRAEFFNFPNHNNFDIPDGSIDSQNFGQITSSRGTPRITQFGLRINW